MKTENGNLKLTVKPKDKKPLEEFLKPQGRFKHLFSPGNEPLLKMLQQDIDKEWNRLLEESVEEG
jgi:pyruvate ferredoxin oxidoreductase beta subunit